MKSTVQRVFKEYVKHFFPMLRIYDTKTYVSNRQEIRYEACICVDDALSSIRFSLANRLTCVVNGSIEELEYDDNSELSYLSSNRFRRQKDAYSQLLSICLGMEIYDV